MPVRLFFTTFIPKRKKLQTQKKRITGLFFFQGEPGAKFAVCNAGGGFAYVGGHARQLPSCLGTFQAGVQRPSPSSTALVRRPPARIWHGRSASSLNTQKNCRWTPIATLFGAAAQGRGWRLGLALTVQQHLVGMTFHSQVR